MTIEFWSPANIAEPIRGTETEIQKTQTRMLQRRNRCGSKLILAEEAKENGQ